jgi:hypothetical protein
VQLPYHLRNLAKVNREVELQVETPVTQQAILDALEAEYPMLRGTIRNQQTGKRRDFIRFFACGEDWSLEPADTRLPEKIANGEEVFMIVGAMAGG